jgi:hypothetical protein
MLTFLPGRIFPSISLPGGFFSHTLSRPRLSTSLYSIDGPVIGFTKEDVICNLIFFFLVCEKVSSKKEEEKEKEEKKKTVTKKQKENDFYAVGEGVVSHLVLN